MKSTHRKLIPALVVAPLALSACFGGGDDGGGTTPPADTTAVPDSALVSSSAWTQFTLTTSQASSETAEPLTADKVGTPPSSETDEPATVS